VCRYTAACSKLLVQIKAAFKQLSDDEYPSVEEFVRKCKVFTHSFDVKTLVVLDYYTVLIAFNLPYRWLFENRKL